MKKRITVLVFLLFLLSGLSVYAAEKLVFTAVVIRHGDRTPYSGGTFTNVKCDWDSPIGELTPEGMRQEYLLGTTFKERYINQLKFLPEAYQANSIYAIATNYNRTNASAVCVLEGMYPPGSGPKLADGKYALPDGIQVIPVFTISEAQRNLINPVDGSPEEFKALKAKYFLGQEKINSINREYQSEFARWGEILGGEVKGLENMHPTADYIKCMLLHDKTLPKGMSKEDAKKLIQAESRAYAAIFQPKEMGCFMAKDFFRQLAADIDLVMSDKQKYKFKLYSGHDDSILGLMSAMGAALEQSPPYASHINFELYRDGQNYKVKVFFNDQPLYWNGRNVQDGYTVEEFKEFIHSVTAGN